MMSFDFSVNFNPVVVSVHAVEEFLVKLTFLGKDKKYFTQTRDSELQWEPLQ